MSVPLKDSLLVPFSTGFERLISLEPQRYGLTVGQAQAYAALSGSYLAAVRELEDLRASGVWSRAQTAARDAARAALVAYARMLYAFVQADGRVSDADKATLGIHLRTGRKARVERPDVRPAVGVVSVVGHTVTVRVRQSAESVKRGKPRGAIAAWVYSFAGEDYPSNETGWRFAGACTNGTHAFAVPGSVAGGTRLWVCAAWVNRRGELGPLSAAISTNVQGGGVSAKAAVKMAA